MSLRTHGSKVLPFKAVPYISPCFPLQTGITEEVRDLIRNVKHAENVDEWTKGPEIGDPITVKPWWPNHDVDIDNDQHFDMKYFPHRDEAGLWKDKADGKLETPLVLLVERTKTLRGEPWYHKDMMERLGLGASAPIGLKRVAVPNMSFYTSKLYAVKHLIKITPVTFPNGLPPMGSDGEEFDPKMAKITIDGNFLHSFSSF